MPSGYTFDSSHGPGVSGSSSGSRSSGSGGSSGSSSGGSAISSLKNLVSNVATTISRNTSTYGDKVREAMSVPSTSARMADAYNGFVDQYGIGFDMDDYYDRILELTNASNTWSAQQAQKQMDFQRSQANTAMAFENQQAERQMQFQRQSDANAMAWSAAEAQKQRNWSERLSDTAHQREIKDLMAAGLNPILSANNGAWAGSGSAGQGFSSSGAAGSGFAESGAMGQTDMSAVSGLVSMLSGSMTTARDLAISKMQVDQSRYNTDMQYAMQKLAAETSIYNNNNNIDANKAINALNRDADIRKAGISANATMAAAAANAGAITSAAATNAAAAKYSADQHLAGTKYQAEHSLEGTKYSSDVGYEGTKYKSDHNMWSDPINYGLEGSAALAEPLGVIIDSIANYNKWKYSDNKE